MKKRVLYLFPMALVLCAPLFPAFLGSCSKGGNGNDGKYPDGFSSRPDTAQVAYVMENASPDSVARFICNASLGKVKNASIRSLAEATLYAYENYRDSALNIFSDEYDRYSEMLPLPDKMKLYSMAGLIDPQGLGYELGLKYVGNIREKKMTADQVEAEIKEFKKACGEDSVTYQRFLKGFQTVLKLDHGKDLSDEIYTRFINYPQ